MGCYFKIAHTDSRFTSAVNTEHPEVEPL